MSQNWEKKKTISNKSHYREKKKKLTFKEHPSLLCVKVLPHQHWRMHLTVDATPSHLVIYL